MVDLSWIPLELAEHPDRWPACSDALEDEGRMVDASCLRLADSLAFPMVWCPPGQFVMGAPLSSDAMDMLLIDRKPTKRSKSNVARGQVKVVLTQGFWIGKYPVTQGDWLRVMDYNPSNFTNDGSKHVRGGDDTLSFPVESMTWYDAAVYLDRVTTRELKAGRIPQGWAYTLPTEAQWEYACRAGTTTKFYFGDDERVGDTYMWSVENSERRLHPVGLKKSNAWGIHDMHGSVNEWCRDVWSEEILGGTDPIRKPSTGRVYPTRRRSAIRGGDFLDKAHYCGSAARTFRHPLSDSYTVGLRACLSERPRWISIVEQPA